MLKKMVKTLVDRSVILRRSKLRFVLFGSAGGNVFREPLT
jgi:hypothetical protein